MLTSIVMSCNFRFVKIITSTPIPGPQEGFIVEVYREIFYKTHMYRKKPGQY